MAELTTNANITWCPGCGNFGIYNAFQRAVSQLEEQGKKRTHIAITSGIGCHGKISDYLKLNGIYSIHGRSIATAEGIKFANPHLTVVAFAGDGDAYGEGISHLIFAAKRNADITVIIHNNGVYALTTGQFSPTSEKGYTGPSTPNGSIEEPLNGLALMMEAGATFVARGYAGKYKHLAEIMKEAMLHHGFSIIDTLQPSVVFNNTYAEYNKKAEIIENTPDNFDESIQLAKKNDDTIPLGIFLKTEKPVFEEQLLSHRVPATDHKSKQHIVKSIQSLLNNQ
jgi:2-oxoglutarate ferredoxin oxidoreductase subunit beta